MSDEQRFELRWLLRLLCHPVPQMMRAAGTDTVAYNRIELERAITGIINAFDLGDDFREYQVTAGAKE